MRLNIFLAMAAALLLPTAPAHSAGALGAKTEYVQIRGDKIAYRSIGSGPPILLATRFRGTLDTWDPLFLDLLAKSHRVIVFDYQGIGYSSGTMPSDLREVAASVAELVRVLKLEKVAVLGWSWGGFIVQSLAVDRPELVSAVILVGTNPPGNSLPPSKAFLDAAFKPTNDLADEEVLFFEPADAASREAAKRSHDRIYARPVVDDRIPRKADQLQAYSVIAKSFREDHSNLRSRFAELPVPKLIITGDNDTSTQGQNWFPLMGQIRNAKFIMYSQTGHGPQHQHPEEVSTQIELFLRNSAAAAGRK